MVAKIIRRNSSLAIKRSIKRELIATSKTGIHPNDTVNDAIDEIERNENLSGSGTASAGSVPWLLKKRRELELKSQNPDRDSSTHR